MEDFVTAKSASGATIAPIHRNASTAKVNGARRAPTRSPTMARSPGSRRLLMVRPLTVIAAASAHATQEARRSVISRWPSIGWIGPSDGSREPEFAVSMLITRAISATASMMPYPRRLIHRV